MFFPSDCVLTLKLFAYFRPVTKSLLQKLLSNVQTVLERYHISRHLFNTAKKLSSLHTATKEQFMLDPWKNVRHLQIKYGDWEHIYIK